MMKRIALLTAVLAIACGDAEVADEPEVMDEPVVEAPAMEAPPAADPGVATVDVSLTEWDITMSQDTLTAGPASFQIRNAGTVAHAFEVEGNGQEWATDEIPPGGTVTMSANLPAGTYEVYCPRVGQSNHEERGMRTTLVVR